MLSLNPKFPRPSDSHQASDRSRTGCVVIRLAAGCQASWCGGIANASGLNIGEYRAQPAQVESALLRHVLHQVAATAGQHRCPLPVQFPDLCQPRLLPVDLPAQSVGD